MSSTVNFLRVGPGGICYAHGPYQADSCPQFPACASDPKHPKWIELGRKQFNARAERSRLESEVISRAKKWANPDMDKSNQSVADLHLFEAVKALLSFEEENK